MRREKTEFGEMGEDEQLSSQRFEGSAKSGGEAGFHQLKFVPMWWNWDTR